MAFGSMKPIVGFSILLQAEQQEVGDRDQISVVLARMRSHRCADSCAAATLSYLKLKVQQASERACHCTNVSVGGLSIVS